MKNQNKRNFVISALFIAAFVLWTFTVSYVDVRPIGPNGSSVGLAAFNSFFRDQIGVNMTLYTVTDWLGLVPVAFAFSFAIIGLVQLIKRKKLSLVDEEIIILGIFFIAVIAVYFLFELIVINHRPVLIDGVLEASYPSSTTVLAVCVMPASIITINQSVKNRKLRFLVVIPIAAFTAFMVFGRLASGVHWISDIIGGLLLSAGLDTAFCSVIALYRHSIRSSEN